MQEQLGERLAKLREPSLSKHGDGYYDCGCWWDSGPYACYCDRHNADALMHDAVTALVEAVESDDRQAVAETVVVVKALLDDPKAGTD